jgi:hypothetical protein
MKDFEARFEAYRASCNKVFSKCSKVMRLASSILSHQRIASSILPQTAKSSQSTHYEYFSNKEEEKTAVKTREKQQYRPN